VARRPVVDMQVADTAPRRPSTQPDAPVLLPGEFAIVAPGDAAHALGHDQVVCPGGYWEPSATLAAHVDEIVGNGLRERGMALEDFDRRYIGIVEDGVRRVCVSATTVKSLARYPKLDWRHDAFPPELDVQMSAFIAIFDGAKNAFTLYFPHPSVAVDSVLDADMEFHRVCGRDLRSPSDACDPVTEENRAAWRRVAGLYEQHLDYCFHVWILPEQHDRSRDAPQPAMRGAFAYKRINDYEAAIRVLQKFVTHYGDRTKMDALRKLDGDRYVERVRFLEMGYAELATTLFAAFRYKDALAVYNAIANDNRFETTARSDAKANAAILSKALDGR